ncbi:MAG: hypothetical protein ACRDSZ_24695, partial [Pseudonocardiaceae bacterium]
QHRDTDQIQQSKQHGLRSCHDRKDATKHQLTTLVTSFGTVQGGSEDPSDRACAQVVSQPE